MEKPFRVRYSVLVFGHSQRLQDEMKTSKPTSDVEAMVNVQRKLKTFKQVERQSKPPIFPQCVQVKPTNTICASASQKKAPPLPA